MAMRLPRCAAAPRLAAFSPCGLLHSTRRLGYCCYRASSRSYYTPSAPQPSEYSKDETAILTAALSHVPDVGFSDDALVRGAVDAGFLPASTNLFARGPFDLVLFHLITQRLALKHNVQFPSAHVGLTTKVRSLVLSRLHANATIQPNLAQALALMSLAGNIPASLRELSLLVDEIWYLAGDTSVDTSWYTKRAMLAGVYSSSEIFMSQDTSPDFRETDLFVERRLDDVSSVGQTAGDVGQWLAFTGMATVNVLRSWGVKV